ncbi:TPA: hypothetical protein ACX6PS_002183 [Photobacterium damselae]
MTAEVAIFNKSAIALAADSAVFVEGYETSKVYNNAEKLFALTKHHPVAIMIYGRNELQGVPWELIIKAFRKQLGNKCFDTILEYKDEFIKFSCEFYFNLSENQLNYWLQENINEIIDLTADYIYKMVKANYDDNIREIDLYDIAINDLLSCFEDADYFHGLNKDSLDECDFYKQAELVISNFIDTDEFSSKEHKDWLNTCNSFYELCKNRLLKVDPFYYNTTGLVFAGYGDKEYFPQLFECEVFGAISGKLKFINKESLSGNQVTAGLKAFAQKEEVSTFMKGVCSSVKNKFYDCFDNLLLESQTIADDLISKYVPEEKQSEERELYLNNLAEKWDSNCKIFEKYTKEKHIDKVVRMITHLPKNELAYMAESLVNLTAFKRKVSNEIDSVGGPIDVAIISKGDGLVWIKRKHYFPQELNIHYKGNN